MRKLLFAGAGALAMISASAAVQAQNTAAAPAPPAEAAAPAMTADQKAMYDTWPASRKADFDAWPAEYKNYFWSLTPEQQEGYLALTPEQREQIYKMAPEQRELAWKSVVEQMKGQPALPAQTQANPQGSGTPTTGVPAPQAAEQSVPPAMPADQSYQGGPYKGALTPPPASAMNKDYPVCTRKIQDSCRNPGGV